MSARAYNLLFLCTGNSARSIMAESLANHWGQGRVIGHSAGSFSKGQVHALALELLRQRHLPTEGLRSKSWDEFAKPGTPVMDFVITVCDQAAGEICPIWPGQPITAHWGVPDPAAAQGSDARQRAAFRAAFAVLEARIRLFTAIDFDRHDRADVRRVAAEIGMMQGAAEYHRAL
jgi:arsenate reductase (thioredoxin)